jgi:malate dehydrogenase (oxaloacetate-decarboxylating)(NADP+)
MNPKPIIFALANPDSEIDYHEAKAARPDAIVATGRSDFPNQVNNVLGFPYIFRGALDVRATEINEAMKVAAVHALADLAREDVPDAVIRAYGGKPIRFGPDYIVPKPLDTRVLLKVVPAVAQAAVAAVLRVYPCPNGRPTSSAWRPAWGRSGRSCAKSFSVHSGMRSGSCCPRETTP